MSGITDAVGEYTESVRSVGHQLKLLQDFPWLWALQQSWPFPGEIKVSSNTKSFYIFFLQSLSDLVESKVLEDRFEVWVKTEHRVFRVDRELQETTPRHKVVRPWNLRTTLAQFITTELKGDEKVEHIVVVAKNTLRIYRHPEKKHLNRLLLECAAS